MTWWHVRLEGLRRNGGPKVHLDAWTRPTVKCGLQAVTATFLLRSRGSQMVTASFLLAVWDLCCYPGPGPHAGQNTGSCCVAAGWSAGPAVG